MTPLQTVREIRKQIMQQARYSFGIESGARLSGPGDEGWIYLPTLLDRLAAVEASAAPEEPEICICAAVRFTDGRIARGHRHHDCFHAGAGWVNQPSYGGEQGFMTSRNRFVNRTEGLQLQQAAGIQSVESSGYRGDVLFSEDLY